MIIWPKATLAISGTCVAIVCTLAGCSKAPSQRGENSRAPANAEPAATSTGLLASGQQEPPLAPPSRTDPEALAMRQKYIQWVEEKAIPEGLHKPSLPDPNRTDPDAIMIRYRYAMWGVAETKVAGDAAIKAQAQALGVDKPAPKGNYGHMADGLPQPSSDHK